MPLTQVQAEKAQPKDKPYRLHDGGGLYLEVMPNGSRYWRLKYRYAGKEKRLALGVFPEISIKEAHRKREQAKDLLNEGIDPGQTKREKKIARKVSAANSFEAVAREWHEKECARWAEGHAARVLTSLETDLFPALAARPIADISAAELLEAVRRVEKRGALETAGRVLQRASAVFRYAIATARLKNNPATDLRGALKPGKVVHRPAISETELPDFLRALDAYPGDPKTRIGLTLILLTLARTHELRGAEWTEFDLEKAEWRVPAERMKMRAPHIVPLSRQAVAALEDLNQLTGSRRLAFPSQSHAETPMSENTMLYAMYRMGYHSRATVHGFRATASTILNEQGFRPDVIERALAHVESNKVRKAYNRAEYLPERREMLQAWADYLDGVKHGAKVVPIRRGRA